MDSLFWVEVSEPITQCLYKELKQREKTSISKFLTYPLQLYIGFDPIEKLLRHVYLWGMLFSKSTVTKKLHYFKVTVRQNSLISPVTEGAN